MRISDWSSDVCSSDLIQLGAVLATGNSAVVSAEAVSTGLLGLPDTVLAKIAQVENAMSTEDIATALIEGGAKEIATASHILADFAGTVVTLKSTSPRSHKQIGRASCRERW